MLNSMDAVDAEILQCLNPAQLNSFFLFAGAGSGKTRCLVDVLNGFRGTHLNEIQPFGKKVAVVTYTNAACDEIRERLEYDPAFWVSTIHSFAWDLIRPFTSDIKIWLECNILDEISKTEEQQRKGRAGTKAEVERSAKLEINRRRLNHLADVSSFKYSPTGTNTEADSLNHAEVIKISAAFLAEKDLLAEILIGKFPILLIDESQDTQEKLIEALMEVQRGNKGEFCLGLLGDQMQRIYSDGKQDLGYDLPDDWIKPRKAINYRCPQRVVTLINKIRENVDEHQQKPSRTDAGFIRLFLVGANGAVDRVRVEQDIANQMAEITGDRNWRELRASVKTLTLEHHMAAKRGGFYEFFSPLYAVGALKTGLIDGSLNGIPFLTQVVLPLLASIRDAQPFVTAQLVKKHSGLLRPDGSLISQQLRKAQAAVVALGELLEAEPGLPLMDILKNLNDTKLLSIPDIFLPILASSTIPEDGQNGQHGREDTNVAWEKALNAPISQLSAYSDYIEDRSSFGTHQGVKGLQFARVMAVLDDQESRGFMFSYEKLLGATEPSAQDKKNEAEGKETGLDRTRRLFYVACSRTKESLAVVVYTKNPSAVRQSSIERGWFNETEVVDL